MDLTIFSYGFIQHALIATILASIVCGIIGTYITVKHITVITGGISHTAFGGVGLGYFIGISPTLCATLFAVTAAITIGVIKEYVNQKLDILIGAIWGVGMALGVLFLKLTPGYTPDFESYLFG
ncbi:MAG TPA: metal ABC transporter permease, partial [Methanocorpusculum sp.]|nr:metal ABC transporter permease [Methanocorpusculum sp.]